MCSVVRRKQIMSTRRLPAAFAQIPEIVYQIFDDLPARGLHTCAQVNRLWYYVASAILRRRVTCSTVFVQERVIERVDALDYCGSLYTKPSVVMLFTYEDIWLTRRDKPRRRDVERQLIKSVRHLYDELPENCQLLGCTTEKLIYHLPENFSAGPVHKKKGHVAVTLPEVHGVRYHTVHVRNLRYHTRDWSRLFRLPPSLEVKLAIVFALPHSRDMIAHIASGKFADRNSCVWYPLFGVVQWLEFPHWLLDYYNYICNHLGLDMQYTHINRCSASSRAGDWTKHFTGCPVTRL